MTILLYPVIFIAVIFFGVKFLRINAKVLSREEFHTEASKRAKHLEHKDPVITCDYCGAKVDTSIHSTCPNCGGTYEKDDEWKRRHSPNFKWAEENAEEVSEEKVEDARKKSKRTLNKFRLAFILLIVFPILILRSVWKQWDTLSDTDFRTDETPNNYQSDAYKRASYEVLGDNVIIDEGGVKVTLTGFYHWTDTLFPDRFGEESGRVKLEFRVENHSERDLYIRFRCGGINGVMSDYGMGDFFGNFKKGSTVTVYEEMYHVRGGIVKDVVYGEVRITDYKDYSFSRNEYLRYQTDAEVSYDSPKPLDSLKYEGNGVRIYTGESIEPLDRETGCLFQIFNDSGTDFIITATEEGFGDSAEGTHIYRIPLPNGYVLRRDRMKSVNREKNLSDVQLSVSFSSAADPSKNFSTGYFSIKP